MKMKSIFFDIRRIIENGEESVVSSQLIDLCRQDQMLLAEDVHEFSDNNTELLKKGIAYLREKTEDIQLEKSDDDGGYRRFYNDHLRPVLESLLTLVDKWDLEGDVTDALREQRSLDQYILKEKYIPQLIAKYQASPRDLASEEIVRFYSLLVNSEDPRDVFQLLEIFIECFNAYDDPESVSCMGGVEERIRRDAGVLASSKKVAGMDAGYYYERFLNGFLTPSGHPGSLLQQIVLHEVLKEFKVTKSISDLQLEVMNLEFIQDIWPRVEGRLNAIVESYDLPWPVAQFTQIEKVQKKVLGDVKELILDITEGYEEVEDDISKMVFLDLFSRANLYQDEASIIEGISQLLAPKGQMTEAEERLFSEAARILGIKEIDRNANILELKDLKLIMIAISLKKIYASMPLEAMIDKVQYYMKDLFKLDKETFRSLEIPFYGIREQCFDHEGNQIIFSSALGNLEEGETISCLSSQHVGKIEKDKLSEHWLVQDLEKGRDVSLDSMVSVIEKLLEVDSLYAVEAYHYLVESYIFSGYFPKGVIELYHSSELLRDSIKIRYLDSREGFEMAGMLKDMHWINEILRDIDYQDFFKTDYILLMERLDKMVLETVIDRYVESGDLGVNDGGFNLLHLAFSRDVKDEQRLKLIEAMDCEDVMMADSHGQWPIDLIANYGLGCSEAVGRAYIEKVETKEKLSQASLLKLIKLLVAPNYILSRLEDEAIMVGYEDESSLFFWITQEGRNPVVLLDRNIGIDWYHRFLDRCPNPLWLEEEDSTWFVELLIGSIAVESQLEIISRVDFTQLNQGDNFDIHPISYVISESVHPLVLEAIIDKCKDCFFENRMSILSTISDDYEDIDFKTRSIIVKKIMAILKEKAADAEAYYQAVDSIFSEILTFEKVDSLDCMLSNLDWDNPHVLYRFPSFFMDIVDENDIVSVMLKHMLLHKRKFYRHIEEKTVLTSFALVVVLVLKGKFSDEIKREVLKLGVTSATLLNILNNIEDISSANLEWFFKNAPQSVLLEEEGKELTIKILEGCKKRSKKRKVLFAVLENVELQINEWNVNDEPFLFYALREGYSTSIIFKLIDFAILQEPKAILNFVHSKTGGIFNAIMVYCFDLLNKEALLAKVLREIEPEYLLEKIRGISTLNYMLQMEISPKLKMRFISHCKTIKPEDIDISSLEKAMANGLPWGVMDLLLTKVPNLKVSGRMLQAAFRLQYPDALINKLVDCDVLSWGVKSRTHTPLRRSALGGSLEDISMSASASDSESCSASPEGGKASLFRTISSPAAKITLSEHSESLNTKKF